MSISRKIYFFSPYDIQRPRTNQLADVHFCEGLEHAGCQLTLFVPTVFRKDNIKRKDIISSYGLETPFGIRYLFTPAFSDLSGQFLVTLLSIYHCFIFFFQLFKPKRNKPTIITRSPRLIYPLIYIKRYLSFLPWPELALWLHDLSPDNSIHRKLYQHADVLLCTNSAIKEDLCRIEGIKEDDVFVTLNPVTAARAKQKLDKKEARKKLDINDNLRLVVYTGKLFIGNKEVDYILEAARLLPQYHFLFTGGKPHVVEHFKNDCLEKGLGNTSFPGYLHDYSQVKYYQQAADVLISYYTTSEHQVRYNFPLKIMEYMLSSNPIVTPDFASTRDVLNDETAVFCEPENSEALVGAIKYAFSKEARQKGVNARAFAGNVTYQTLGFKIKAFIFETASQEI